MRLSKPDAWCRFLARDNSTMVDRKKAFTAERRVRKFVADWRMISCLTDSALYDAYPGYESLLWAGKDKIESWLSIPLPEACEAAGKSRMIGKQLYSGDGWREGEEDDGFGFMSFGKIDTRESVLVSLKTVLGETYGESL